MRRDVPLVIATHNAGKLGEIADLVAPFGLTVKGAAELGLPEPEETGSTFAENAALKARAAAAATGWPALADDSGLVVPTLNGAPGIYSARWAGPRKDFSAAIERLRGLLGGGSNSRPGASFVCVLALAETEDRVKMFEGEVRGRLTFPPRGKNGFGYDPIFIAEGMQQTFGELEPARKHAISHRARAFEKLKDYLSLVAARQGGSL